VTNEGLKNKQLRSKENSNKQAHEEIEGNGKKETADEKN
jgi:hypothetical protein